MYIETKILAEYLNSGEDFNLLRKRNVEENLIKYNKTGAISRVNAPIFKRLKFMQDSKILGDFIFEDVATSKYYLLYAIMKTDSLVRDFVIDVYKKKLLMNEEYIEKHDIENWYQEKFMLSKTLKSVTVATENKLKQVVLKIMQDANMVVKEKDKYKINKPLLKTSFIDTLRSLGDESFAKAIGGLV